jgi:hypothetical protein
MHCSASDGTALVAMVEAGGPGGAKELLAMRADGRARHWRDARNAHHNIDFAVTLERGETVTVRISNNDVYVQSFLYCFGVIINNMDDGRARHWRDARNAHRNMDFGVTHSDPGEAVMVRFCSSKY